MTDLRELEKRLEEATGPSQELDDAVFRACGLKVYPYDEPSGTTWGAAYPVTKSLDAAVSLCERIGFSDYSVCTFGAHDSETVEGVSTITKVGPLATVHVSGSCHVGRAATPALALCLALVRALIAKGDRHD